MSEYRMIALTLEIAAIFLVLMVGAGIYLFRKAVRAPIGYEDLAGFHLGDESPARDSAYHLKRVGPPAIRAAAENTIPDSIHHVPPAQAAL